MPSGRFGDRRPDLVLRAALTDGHFTVAEQSDPTGRPLPEYFSGATFVALVYAADGHRLYVLGYGAGLLLRMVAPILGELAEQ